VGFSEKRKGIDISAGPAIGLWSEKRSFKIHIVTTEAIATRTLAVWSGLK
jgi:hypothetical protein